MIAPSLADVFDMTIPTIKTGNEWMDKHLGFACWADVRKMTLRPQGIGWIEVMLKDPMKADQVKGRLEKLLPGDVKIESWIKD